MNVLVFYCPGSKVSEILIPLCQLMLLGWSLAALQVYQWESKILNVSCSKANSANSDGTYEKWHSLVDLDNMYNLAKLLRLALMRGLLNVNQSIFHNSHDSSTLQRGKLPLTGTFNHLQDIGLWWTKHFITLYLRKTTFTQGETRHISTDFSLLGFIPVILVGATDRYFGLGGDKVMHVNVLPEEWMLKVSSMWCFLPMPFTS